MVLEIESVSAMCKAYLLYYLPSPIKFICVEEGMRKEEVELHITILMNVHSGIIPGSARGTLCGTIEGNQVSHMQDKCLKKIPCVLIAQQVELLSYMWPTYLDSIPWHPKPSRSDS